MSIRKATVIGRLIIGFYILTTVFFISCRSDNEFEISTESLEGDWTIIEAYREDRKTKLLDNGIFSFLNNQYFKTNILQDSNQYKFILNEKMIFVEDSSRSRYDVIGFSQDTLTLKSTIHDFGFKFVLKKVNTNEE